jgi:hypothetical protein
LRPDAIIRTKPPTKHPNKNSTFGIRPFLPLLWVLLVIDEVDLRFRRNGAESLKGSKLVRGLCLKSP